MGRGPHFWPIPTVHPARPNLAVRAPWVACRHVGPVCQSNERVGSSGCGDDGWDLHVRSFFSPQFSDPPLPLSVDRIAGPDSSGKPFQPLPPCLSIPSPNHIDRARQHNRLVAPICAPPVPRGRENQISSSRHGEIVGEAHQFRSYLDFFAVYLGDARAHLIEP